MARLIIIPQYPAKLRYQEWWATEFKEQYQTYFDEVLMLGDIVHHPKRGTGEDFCPIDTAIQYEIGQMREYTNLRLRKDDVLLLNDLSFPGLFSNLLFHKRPNRCFAICHATAKNRYDLFQPVRGTKYPVEKVTAKLFDGVFVGSQYHASKLNWRNTIVTPLPQYPQWMLPKKTYCPRDITFASVARPGIQKTTKKTEKRIERVFGEKIQRPKVQSWKGYFQFLQRTVFLLITAKEETYGYQSIDATMNGAIPLAPRRYSYPEILSDQFLYEDEDELISKIEFFQRVRPIRDEIVKENNFYEATAEIMKGKT